METLVKKDTIHKVDWSKQHNGIMLCSFEKAIEYMPDIAPILYELIDSGLLEMQPSEYVVDVKVHMLMPGMYPCIPNWHCDFLPRDEDGNRLNIAQDKWPKMYEWISGQPYTEFRNPDSSTYYVMPHHWHAFDQRDLHRGTLSNDHQWRGFIRVIPKSFIHPSTKNIGTKRQHIQVYLPSPEKFRW